ncbi:MAG: glycosyltransferase family 2 protein [Candidatus Limnocylindrales bacterium]
MNPGVSLLVPVFNRAELLVPCLDSALAQTMPDLEVVVVDGASTDGTWDVCLRYAAADSRVRIFRDAVNSGPVRGWWRCLEEARGTYATFLWSDDLLQPTFLARTVPVLADSDVGFVFTAAESGVEPGRGRIIHAQPSRRIPSDEFVEGSLGGAGKYAGMYPGTPVCALFRLADLRQSFMMEIPTEPKTDLTSTGAGVDVFFFLLTALRYPWVACLSEPLAFLRVHGGSISVDGRGGQVALDYAVAKSWFARTYGYGALAGRILAYHWLSEMRTFRRFVSPRVATRRYRRMASPWELSTAAAALVAKRVTRAAAAGARRLGRARARP